MEAPNKPTHRCRTVPILQIPARIAGVSLRCATLLQIQRRTAPVPEGVAAGLYGWDADAEAAPDRMEPCVPTPPG